MTLDADILERPAPAAPPGPDPRIAVAEGWLYMLSALTGIGVRFANFLSHMIAPSRDGAKRPMMAFRFTGDPTAAFERVWRAVRLAAALALRICEEIDALRAGKPLDRAAPAPTAPRAKAAPMDDLAEAAAEATRLGDEIREIGREVLGEDMETPDQPEGLHGDLHEPLREGREDPAFYRLLNGPLKEAIAAICADLGLKPDWSLWTEDGFPPPPGGGKEDWIAFFAPDFVAQEGEDEATHIHEDREPTRPPRYGGDGGRDKGWRPPWPPPQPHDPSPPPHPAARGHSSWNHDHRRPPGDA
jgi:hypothetical protein